MMTKHKYDNPILVTGAAGAVGGIGRNLTESLLAGGHKVRAFDAAGGQQRVQPTQQVQVICFHSVQHWLQNTVK
jgi:nucleoside-diphosphate-sugar epimerase